MALLGIEGFDHFPLGTSWNIKDYGTNITSNCFVRGTSGSAAIPSATVVGTVPSGMTGKVIDLASASNWVAYDNLNTTGLQDFAVDGGKYTLGFWLQWDDYTATTSTNFMRFHSNNFSVLETPITAANVDLGAGNWGFRFTCGSTNTTTFLPSTWYHIEVLLDIDNDQVTMKVDGTTELNAVSYTFDHTTDWRFISIYGLTSSFYVDHLYVLDDTGTQNNAGLGIHIVYPIEPDADHATIFDWSFTEASGYASLVWGDTTYVYTDVVDDEFRVSFDPISSVANTTTVYGMAYDFYTELDVITYGAYIRDRLTDGTNTSTSSSYSVGSVVHSGYVYNTDLAGTAWTLSQADNMEAGVIFDGI